MASTGIANTPLINYFFYKQSTSISSADIPCCNVFTSVADGGNGFLVITTPSTYLSLLSVGVAITLGGGTIYDGNYSVISVDTGANTFVVSGVFTATAAGTWELASNVSSANAGDPLDYGVITFYRNDNQVTLQDTYSDRGLTVANPNPITLDAIGSYPPIYLQDLPYYIVIRDKFNNLVATLENYLPKGESGGNTGAEIANLFANYGFDTKINANLYSENSVEPNVATAVSAGWKWGIVTTQTDAVNTYTYQVVSDQGLLANPKNSIRFSSTNKTGGETVNRLFSIIGDYNKFQGLQLGFSIYAQLISGFPQDLTCQLLRTRDGVGQTPISIGTIPINFTQTQLTFLFTVPFLSDADYSNDDTLRFIINFPLNEDFVIDLTGTWLQISADGVISPSEESGSVVAGKEFFGETFRALQSEEQFTNRGLPLVIGEGQADLLNLTGTIFQATEGSTFNYAQSMGKVGDTDAGVELLRDNILGLTQTNRLIDYLRDNNMTQSRHTFVITQAPSSNTISIETGIGVAPNSTWASLDAGIVLAEPTHEFTYVLNSTALGNGEIKFTFTEMFNAFTAGFRPTYSGTSSSLFPALSESVIIDWFISVDYLQGQANGVCKRSHYFSSEVISNGSASTYAEINFKLKDVQSISYASRGSLVSNVSNNDGTYFIWETPNIYSSLNFTRALQFNQNPVSYVTGFWAYNDIDHQPNPQTSTPPRTIKFSVDGAAVVGPTPIVSNLTIPISSSMNKEMICATIVEYVNTSYIKTLTINTLTNGAIVQLSSDQTDFNLIFWDTAQTKPANPDTRVPIYVEYTTTQTTDEVATTAKTQLERAVMGIPKAADLGLYFGDSLEYFMSL